MTSTVDEHAIDTHALLWHLVGSPRLGARARAVLEDPAARLILPATALAEACWIVERGRTTIPSVAALLLDIDADPRITLTPLDREVIDLTTTLTAIPEMHDRQIAATVLVRARLGLSVALITSDRSLIASGLVPIVW